MQDVALRHAGVLGRRGDFDWRVDRLCELNVIEQVVHVSRTTIVEEAWRRGQPLSLHGLVYGLADGVLRDLGVEARSADELRSRYEPAVARCASAG